MQAMRTHLNKIIVRRMIATQFALKIKFKSLVDMKTNI